MKKSTFDPSIEISQHELIEKVQRRVKQKKGLYIHFFLFLVGSVFFLIFNKVLGYYPEYNWSLWAMTVWAFLVCVHGINVFIINKFIGDDWEREQREKLVRIQKKKIAQLQEEVEKEYPLIDSNKEIN